MTTELSRRTFLKLSSLSLAGWSVAPALEALPRMAFAPEGVEPGGDVLVCVFQRGGMDGLNAVIPQFEAEYFRQRSTLAIPESASGDDQSAIDLDGRFALHPALRPLKEVWDDGGLAIVHAVGSPDPTHSHFDAMDYMERGTPGEKTIATGWIGRHLQTAPWQNESPFRAVGMGGILQASLRGPVPVTTLQSIADFHLQGNTSELARMQRVLASLYSLAPSTGPGQGVSLDEPGQTTFSATDLLAGIDVANYAPENSAQYPDSQFGRALMQVAQIVKAEIGLEVACVDMGGWDTHAAQGGLTGGPMPGLLAEFAGGLAALYHDLGELRKRVTIVTMSEFGRRVSENGSAGTDHGHGGVMFALGDSANVNGGVVHGDWPGLDAEYLYGPGDLDTTSDYRDVLGELVRKRLGNGENVEDIFPDFDVDELGVFTEV